MFLRYLTGCQIDTPMTFYFYLTFDFIAFATITIKTWLSNVGKCLIYFFTKIY